MSFATFCVCLELRSLPSAGVTRFPRYYEPLRHPRAPGLSPHGRPVGPVIPDLTTLWGFPCCARFPCVRAAATTPVQRLGVVVAHLTQPYQPSPITLLGRPAHRPFRGLLSVHSRCGPAHSRGDLYVTCYTEGFSHFVTSMTAPVASGWSGCRVRLAPTGKRRLVTAHT
jgi:hypothetical protein